MSTFAGARASLGQRIAAIIAALFGLATLIAGGRVLLGYSDPGYVVYQPLLIYNTVMGLAYVAAGALIWFDLPRGKIAALGIFFLNLLALAGVMLLFSRGGGIAVESVRAMVFRTSVWLALFVVLAWKGRR